MRLTQVFLGFVLMLLSPSLQAQLNILNAKLQMKSGKRQKLR